MKNRPSTLVTKLYIIYRQTNTNKGLVMALSSVMENKSNFTKNKKKQIELMIFKSSSMMLKHVYWPIRS